MICSESIELTLIRPDLEILIPPQCKIVMPMLPLLWKTKHRQLPLLGSNLAPSTETLVIACCCRLNESVEMPPYKTRTNLRGYPTVHSADSAG